jgi:hypothetical protein
MIVNIKGNLETGMFKLRAFWVGLETVLFFMGDFSFEAFGGRI